MRSHWQLHRPDEGLVGQPHLRRRQHLDHCWYSADDLQSLPPPRKLIIAELQNEHSNSEPCSLMTVNPGLRARQLGIHQPNPLIHRYGLNAAGRDGRNNSLQESRAIMVLIWASGGLVMQFHD